MGNTISRLLPCCFGREETKDIETDHITPKNIQPDTEHDTSNLDNQTNDLYDMRHLKYSTLDRLEHGTRIKGYIFINWKVVHIT